jgi:hypothetical protein
MQPLGGEHVALDQESGSRRKTLSDYLTKIARLGGYLARAKDPPGQYGHVARAIAGAEIVGN